MTQVSMQEMYRRCDELIARERALTSRGEVTVRFVEPQPGEKRGPGKRPNNFRRSTEKGRLNESTADRVAREKRIAAVQREAERFAA